jgi:hypothetical protein
VTTQLSSLPFWWRVEAIVLLVIGAGSCWSFVTLYWVTFKWWRNDFGRHLIAMSSCLGAFFTYYLILVAWPDLPGRGLIRLILFHLLVVTVVWRLVVFGRVELAKKRERARGPYGGATARD